MYLQPQLFPVKTDRPLCMKYKANDIWCNSIEIMILLLEFYKYVTELYRSEQTTVHVLNFYVSISWKPPAPTDQKENPWVFF